MRLDQEIKYREARAREEGHAAGLSEGQYSKAKEIAAEMKSAGESYDKITLFTGLSEEKIKKL